MFVPKAALSSAASLRNPRRRQRTSSDESMKPPSAKRQRSTLREENPKINPAGLPEHQIEAETLKPITSASQDDSDPIDSLDGKPRRSIPIRTSKPPEKRRTESDETIVLSKTDFYTVSQLPSLPDQIRSLQSESLRCFFTSTSSYALAVSFSHAIIWPYSALASSLSPSDVFRVSIPESCRESNNRVPLGVILSTATSAIPGLMILMPCNGKIIYWETMSNATSLGLPRQKQTGILGSIPGMLSGEYATDIVNGEPAGIIVTFSSGRVAHITVRDPQGKPAITVNFLKNSSSSSRIGLLGGIKNVLGGGFWRKDVAAVRAGASYQRGQRDIIIATSTGLVEIWDTHWNNGSMLKRQFDIKHEMRNSFGIRDLDRPTDDAIKVLDFAFTDSKAINMSDSQVNSGKSWKITLLVALTTGTSCQRISVVQVELSEDTQLLSFNPISPHTIPTTLDGPQPKIFVPDPGETAFVVIGQSVTLLSLASGEGLPNSQTLLDNYQPQTFYDSIHIRTGRDYEILGTGFEDQNADGSLPACLLMIRRFGVVRVSLLPRVEPISNIEDMQITAQHKIEQAVFYGTMQGNPLNLASKSGLDYPVKEIEEAALEICKQLLQSKLKFIPTAAISIDQNLKLRAKALDDLSQLLLQQGKIFDRRVWWELLWGAEKLAAQKAMWKLEENSRRSHGKGPTFLGHVLGLMNEKFKTRPDMHEGTSDPVRHWFLYDTFQMEHIVPWIYNAIKLEKGNASKQIRRMSEYLLEASELSLAVLETAFQFRDEHASQFGIGDGYIEDGVLISGFEDLPEFWTSRSIGYSETSHLLNLELDKCRDWIKEATTTTEASDHKVIGKIARNCSRHLYVLGQIHSERIRWLSAQEDPKLVDESLAIEQSHVEQRRWQLYKLAGIGQLDDAISLAEKFRDMVALVELIIELQDQTKVEILTQSPFENVPNGTNGASQELNGKISHYFEKFGDSWADAFFKRLINMGQAGTLFSMKKFQPFITRFLHKNPGFSRLGWINDVVGEGDYDTASKTLENLALEHETDIWSHRVELSLAKLAKLAAWDEIPSPSFPALQDDIRRLDDFGEVGAVQEVIYASISPVFQNAIDEKAEIDLALDHLANLTTQDWPSLQELLSEALVNIVSRKVIGVDQLVDLLTLMDPVQVPDYGQNELLGREFYLALRVIQLGPYAKRDPQYHIAVQKLVWRRCIIRDNWDATGKAVEEMGSESEDLLHNTSLFRTLVSCLKDKQNEDPNYPSLYLPTSPDDVLMSDSDSLLLVSRFRTERRSRISRDLDRENAILSQYIEKVGLGFWFKNLITFAEKTTSHRISYDTQRNDEAHIEQLNESAEASTEKARLNWL